VIDLAPWGALLEECAGLSIERGGARQALARHLAARFEDEASRAAGLERARSDPDALAELIDAITIPHTVLFRDAPHLFALEGAIRSFARARPLAIWVPGCASGEDAFSIAAIALHEGVEVDVLGTDLNSRALESAERGTLAVSASPVPHALLRWFVPTRRGARPHQALASRVRFARHNLLDAPPDPKCSPHWDLIVCRNVLIYFSARARAIALHRLAYALAPRGRLLLGPNDAFSELPRELGPTPELGRILLERRPASLPVLDQTPARAASVAPIEEAPELALLARGHALFARGDLAGAHDCYAAAIDLAPVDPEPRLYAAIVQRHRGELESAVRGLRGCLFLAPDLWPAAYYLARSLEDLGRRDDARIEYARLVASADAPLPLRHAGAPIDELLAYRRDLLARARKGR
jgi:chemotaxis protein methyltransferase CheR